MESVHFDNPYPLTKEQRRTVIARLLSLYHERFDLKGKDGLWGELPGKAPELAAYSPDVLRFYTHLCILWHVKCL